MTQSTVPAVLSFPAGARTGSSAWPLVIATVSTSGPLATWGQGQVRRKMGPKDF